MSTRRRRPTTTFEATTELEFQVTDDRSFLIVESGRADCEIVVDEIVPQSSGNLLEYLSVFDGATSRVLADALEWPDVLDARLVAEDEDASLLELVVTECSLAATVADSRAIPRHISASRGEGHVVIEVPSYTDPQQVIELFRERHPDSRLVARREHETGPLVAERMFRERVLRGLTDKQRETLVTAFEKGYFDRPREVTAADCAGALGISQSTFSQHLRVALDKVLGALLDESR